MSWYQRYRLVQHLLIWFNNWEFCLLVEEMVCFIYWNGLIIVNKNFTQEQQINFINFVSQLSASMYLPIIIIFTLFRKVEVFVLVSFKLTKTLMSFLSKLLHYCWQQVKSLYVKEIVGWFQGRMKKGRRDR